MYFEIFDPVMPIVNQTRFYAALAQQPDSIHVRALSHALGALGALAKPGLAHIAKTSHIEARNLLDMCEREEGDAMFGNINSLQACILLTFYELKQPNFARAWMTLGRAIRLSKIMGLPWMDTEAGVPALYLGPFTPLPSASVPAETEERRRTFWQLYILEAFTGMRTNWVSPFEEVSLLMGINYMELQLIHVKISVRLPCLGVLAEVAGNSDMPTLESVFEAPETPTCLSPFAGMVIVATLYRRCRNLIHKSLQGSLYPFWDTYYQIDKLISRTRSLLLGEHLEIDDKTSHDPLSLIVSMNLAAVEISLSELVISKVENEQLRCTPSAEAISRCISASSCVVEAIRAGMRRPGKELIFKQSGALFTWAMTAAIQTYLWMLLNGKSNVSTHIESLRFLSEAMRELVGPMFIRPGLLEQVDAKIAEAEPPAKRSRR